jgi:hypothetical protein
MTMGGRAHTDTFIITAALSLSKGAHRHSAFTLDTLRRSQALRARCSGLRFM